jgi:hypothetical protein
MTLKKKNMAIRLISSNAPSTTPDFPEESPASGDRLDEFKGVAKNIAYEIDGF